MHEEQVRGPGEDEATVAAGAVPVHGALDREEQIGFALHLVQDQPGRAPEEVRGVQPGMFPRLQIVEREIEPVFEERFGLHQCALAGLAGAHQHDDGRSGEGALQQPRGEPGQIV